MVASDEYLVSIRQFYEPVQEVKNLFLCALLSEVTTMHNNISIWQIGQLLMFVVSVRDL